MTAETETTSSAATPSDPTLGPSPLRRTRARRGEGELLREQILDATERLLGETGDDEGVTIRAVADAVGVTPPSIYLHFADKDGLLFAVCERQFMRLDELSQAAAASADDPVDALVRRGRAYVRFGMDHPEAYRIMFMNKPWNQPDELSVERLQEVASFGHLLENVAGCVADGLVVGDPLIVSIGLWAVVHGLTSMFIAQPNFPWPDVDGIIEHVLRTQIHGLAPR